MGKRYLFISTVMAGACAAWGLAAYAAPAEPAPAAAAPVAPPPLAAYGALPSVSDLTISPDGHQFAFLVGAADQRQLQVRTMADLANLMSVPVGAAKVRAIEWVGENHLILITSVTAHPIDIDGPKREFLLALNVDLVRRKGHPLVNGIARTMSSIASVPTTVMHDGKPEVVVEDVFFPDDHGVLALYRVEPESTRAVQIAQGTVATDQYLVGPDGEPVARADYFQHDGVWQLLIDHKGAWTKVMQVTAPLDHPTIKGLGPDGTTVLIDVHDDHGWTLNAVSIADGSVTLPPKTLDGAMLMDERTHRAIGGVTTHMDGEHYHFVNDADQKAWNAVAHAFAGEAVTLESWSDDRKQIIVRVEGPKDGAGFYTVDLTKGSAKWLADERDGIGPENVAEKRVVDYAAADGTKIPAYLTLPKGKGDKNLPLVVLPHGGPAARDEPGFDWWAQALASRGYAVLQPEFRGSTGFGEEHLEAGYGQWGRKMQTDLSDGVRDLVKKGIIDPKRVCIMGASYGGYAALAAVTFDPQPYRCAVALAGPANLRHMLAYEREMTNRADAETIRYWERFMGAESMNDPTLDDISPALHADKAAVPLMIIQGQDDTVVPFNQSKEMADAMKRAGKPYEFVILKSEDHWLSRGETRMQMLDAAVGFLQKNNPAD